MKKFFEKHTVAKLIAIFIFIALVLSWFVPSAQFSGSDIVKTEKISIGIHDITTILTTSINFIIDKIIYLLVLGGFYAVLLKCDGYKKLVSDIAKKIKGKEVVFTIGASVVLTLLTSVLTQSFVVLLFVPFVIQILRTAGINKMTSFAATFGALLVGALGATYGYEALISFDAYFSSALNGKNAMDLTIAYRAIILVIGVALYNFFLYFAVKKSLSSKKGKDEGKADEFVIEEVKSKNVKTFPVIVVLALALIISLLGFVNWYGIFKLEIFNDFHNWLIGLKVGKDFTLVGHLLGSSMTAFGTWTLLNMSVVLVILSLLLSLLYSISIDDFFTSFGSGAKRLLKSACVIVAIYVVFVTSYMGGYVPKLSHNVMKTSAKPTLNIDYKGAGIPIFNVDTDEDGKADYNFINQDVDKDGKCDLNCDTDKDGYPDEKLDFDANGESDENDAAIIAQLVGESRLNVDSDGDGVADVNLSKGFNLFKAFTGAIVTNVFNTDLGYTGYSMSAYLVSNYGGENVKLIFLVFAIVYALIQFVLPTGVILAVGLTYTGVSLGDWLKYAWRYVLGMLCIILIIFIFILIV